MKRTLIISACACVGATMLFAAAPAMAHVDVGINLGVPAPVYVAPQPVYVQPAPVYAPPPPFYGRYYHHHRHHHHRDYYPR